MQEQKTNLEKIINTSIDEIRQKMLTICENRYKSDLDYNSAIGFIGQIKEVISELKCQVVKEYFESSDEPVLYIGVDNKRYLKKGKSTKEIITSLEKIGISRSYYQLRSGGNSLFPLDEKLGVNGKYSCLMLKRLCCFHELTIHRKKVRGYWKSAVSYNFTLRR